MRTPEMILEEAARDGRVWLGGEMEFPYGATPAEAYPRMVKIAEACGYLVERAGRSRIHVTGAEWGDAYYILDWYDSDRPGPWAIALYDAETADRPLFRKPGGGFTSNQAESTTPLIQY